MHLKKKKKLNEGNWENDLLASIGKSPSNGHHMEHPHGEMER